jgi:hypothetical protein
MWGALIRVGARYAFFRRWKNTIILVAGVLLCAITALLIDAKMYLSAGFIGILAVAVMLGLAAHYLRERREVRENERRKLEQAAKRAAAAEARSERMDKLRATATGVAKGVSGSAAGFVNVAKTGFSDTRDKFDSWRNKAGRDGPKT